METIVKQRTKTCGTCMYALFFEDGDVECHRGAPQGRNNHGRCWPIVYKGDWCGEYKVVMVDDLDGRLTALRAGNLDNLKDGQ